jgi:lipoate-protein ligase A
MVLAVPDAPSPEVGEQWLLVDSGELSGSLAMAMHEAWLDRICKTDSPILHLWTWVPSAVSVGYNQPLDRFDFRALAADRVLLIRRPTGGKAVFHCGDLSFACVVPRPYRDWDRGLRPPYAFLALAIGEALRLAGCPCSQPNIAPREHIGTAGVACSSEIYAHELMRDGRKVLGSSQRRTAGGVLIQGTIAPQGGGDLSPYLVGSDTTRAAKQRLDGSVLSTGHIAAGFRKAHGIGLVSHFPPLHWLEKTRCLAAARYRDLVPGASAGEWTL